jgi:hypothetical protein
MLLNSKSEYLDPKQIPNSKYQNSKLSARIYAKQRPRHAPDGSGQAPTSLRSAWASPSTTLRSGKLPILQVRSVQVFDLRWVEIAAVASLLRNDRRAALAGPSASLRAGKLTVPTCQAWPSYRFTCLGFIVNKPIFSSSCGAVVLRKVIDERR